jgi:thioredoxin reductase
MLYDVVIVGGGPAGLSAALNLGRARRGVLLCDGGPRRNAAAEHVHGFVTRDGITPNEFRAQAREQLRPYSSVELRDVRVDAISGECGAFQVQLGPVSVQSRRILLCTGLVDELPEVEGFHALWGHTIVQCPYCHGWEARDRRFAYWATNPELLDFALLLRGWTHQVTLLTDGKFAVSAEAAARLASAGVRLEERPIQRLSAKCAEPQRLEQVEFIAGEPLPLDLLFTHPKQSQVDVVRALDLTLDANGLVLIDEQRRETSRPGIYAGGDLHTRAQGAVLAAANAMLAAAALNHGLIAELALSGALHDAPMLR